MVRQALDGAAVGIVLLGIVVVDARMGGRNGSSQEGNRIGYGGASIARRQAFLTDHVNALLQRI